MLRHHLWTAPQEVYQRQITGSEALFGLEKKEKKGQQIVGWINETCEVVFLYTFTQFGPV